jgi:hypothetical protein
MLYLKIKNKQDAGKKIFYDLATEPIGTVLQQVDIGNYKRAYWLASFAVYAISKLK